MNWSEKRGGEYKVGVATGEQPEGKAQGQAKRVKNPIQEKSWALARHGGDRGDIWKGSVPWSSINRVAMFQGVHGRMAELKDGDFPGNRKKTLRLEIGPLEWKTPKETSGVWQGEFRPMKHSVAERNQIKGGNF